MKTMTCKQLGGACNKEFHAETFDEIKKQSMAHGHEMFQKGDEAHMNAMREMKELMNNQEAMNKWMENKRKEFNSLPDMKNNGDERAIRELIDTWMKASKEGDIETVLSLMTDDVVFMVVGQEPFGKKEFKEMSEKIKDSQIDGTSEIREIKILGDWAYVRNYLKISMDSVKKSGYTLTILRKENGKWKLARDANLLTEEG